jgi:hypothetical protein
VAVNSLFIPWKIVANCVIPVLSTFSSMCLFICGLFNDAICSSDYTGCFRTAWSYFQLLQRYGSFQACTVKNKQEC